MSCCNQCNASPCCCVPPCQPLAFCEPENFGLTFPSLVGPPGADGAPGGPGTYVESLAALRLLSVTTLPDGYIANIAGYASTNDGGGGLFVYVLASTATDNNGTIVEPAVGIGAWFRIYSGDVSVKWFGATGDGVTADQAAVQAAINVALDGGATTYFPAGRYKINAVMSALGSVRMRGDGRASIIDGSGNPFSVGGPDLGFSFSIGAGLETTPRTATGALYNGSNSFTLSSVAGLTTGSSLYLQLGIDPTDATQPFLRMFGKIATLVGNTITLDNPVPEDINGTNHQIWLNQKPCQNLSITNLRFNMFPLNMGYIQNGNISDIFIDTSVATFLIINSYGVTFERIQAENIISAGTIGISPSYGWFIQGWGHYGIYISDVQIRNLSGVAFYSSESQSRECFAENIRIGVTKGLGIGNYSLFTAAAGTRPSVVRNLYITTLDVLSTRSLGGGDGAFVYDNVYIVGNNPAGVAYISSPPINLYLSGVRGVVRWNNRIYINRVPFLRVLKFPTGATAKNYSLGVKGMLSRCRIFVSSTTGINGLYHYNGSGFVDVTSELTSGQFKDTNGATNINPATPNGITDDRVFRVDLSGAQAAGSFAVIQGEVIESTASIETQPEIKVGSGPPATAPDFLQQQYFDATNIELYQATDLTGVAVDDWTSIWNNRASASTISSKVGGLNGIIRFFTKTTNFGTVGAGATLDVLRFQDSNGTLIPNVKIVSGFLILSAYDQGNPGNGSNTTQWTVQWNWIGVGSPAITQINAGGTVGTNPVAAIALVADGVNAGPKVQITTGAAGNLNFSASFIGIVG